ncbi:MAG: hypothetical protein ABJP45_10510 [Cyclobacteriaceae bacterium]
MDKRRNVSHSWRRLRNGDWLSGQLDLEDPFTEDGIGKVFGHYPIVFDFKQ